MRFFDVSWLVYRLTSRLSFQLQSPITSSLRRRQQWWWWHLQRIIT